MKKIIVLFKDREDETKINEMEVTKYYDLGSRYEFHDNEGVGYMRKERVVEIKIIKEEV